jgi:hypothetical protein
MCGKADDPSMHDVEPACDLCGKPEDHRPGWYEYDWNGETGNHLSCERDALNVEGDPTRNGAF